MFVFNIKLNLKLIVKILFILMAITVIFFFLFSTYKIIKRSIEVKDEIPTSDISYIEANNYTNILKSVYENLDTYIGQKICFSGYIYKNIDFNENQFVLARDMTTSSDKTLIVGFLCEYNKLKDFKENDWVEIVGEITKGTYHGEIPIIKVKKIKIIDAPNNPLVNPPDDTYIPTAIIY